MPLALTATEQRIMDILHDGALHTREQLHTCVNDELSSYQVLQQHICNLRKKLATVGEGISTIREDHKVYYRHVRRVHSSVD